MLVKFFALVFAFWLTFMPAPVAGAEGQSPANRQQSKDSSQDESFLELLEFLGQWETDDGKWVDPTDLDWLMTPDQETKDDEKKKP